jgi:hypothetical protein
MYFRIQFYGCTGFSCMLVVQEDLQVDSVLVIKNSTSLFRIFFSRHFNPNFALFALVV